MADLKSLPVAGAHPPDARIVSHNEHDAEQTIDGPVPAIVGDVFATAASAADVFDYYEARLPDLGFTRDHESLYRIETSIEDEVRVWRDGSVVARVAVYAAGEPQLPPLPSDMTGGTLFELALIAVPPDQNATSS